MRLLSDEELDQVLGGGDTYSATKLATVNVNATIAANPATVWSVGAPDFGAPPTYESGGAVLPCYANYFYARSLVPTFPHLRCVASHTVFPGMDIPQGVDLVLLNDHVSGVAGSNGLDMTNLHTSTSTYPSGDTGVLNGVYQSTSNYSKITITANALEAVGSPISYIDVNTGASLVWNAGLTASEHQAFVLGHEAAHAHGIADEERANGYGMYAVHNFDHLPAGTCP